MENLQDAYRGGRKRQIMKTELFKKVYGCMAGLAIGDAFGMPAALTFEANRKKFHGWLDDFVAPSPDDQNGHAGLKAAEITDDTFAMLAVVRSVLRTGSLSMETVADELVAWIKETDGLNLSYVGPSTKRAIQALMDGVPPTESGKDGWTNGAAMRVAPVGFLHAPDLEAVSNDAMIASYPTHATSTAVSGAAAVACAVAGGVLEGATIADVVEAAKIGADIGETLGVYSTSPSISRRIDWAVELVSDDRDDDAHLKDLYDLVGTGMPTYEIVPSALAIFVMAEGDPVRAIKLSANAGGDCDTLGAIAGAITGAYAGVDAIPVEMIKRIEAVNQIGLELTAKRLTSLIQKINSENKQ